MTLNQCKKVAQKIAGTKMTVLLSGESGTGKELFAHSIHAASRRARGPFVKINCAAIPDSLLESEFFGYEAGAFSGAAKAKMGKFEPVSYTHLAPAAPPRRQPAARKS